MIPKGLFTQVSMIILSIAIIITYVKPTFDSIGSVQDETQIYIVEHSKVASVNSELNTLVDRMNSVTNEDLSRLFTYMPDAVDEIYVQRDLFQIVLDSGVSVSDISHDGELKKSKKDLSHTQAHSFGLVVEGKYEQIKKLFSLLEQNNYPLEINEVAIKQSEDDLLIVNIVFLTYSFNNEVISNDLTI